MRDTGAMQILTGVDLVSIPRIAHSLQNPRFLKRIFSVQERELFMKSSCPLERISANFAAKEDFSKALGTGVRGFSLSEVSVLRDEVGCPYFYLTGKAADIAQRRKLSFSVSLSHTADMACAFVVAYQRS